MTTQPSKPHIKLIFHVWHCRSIERAYSNGQFCAWSVTGLGYTPAQAYEDWKKGRVR